MLRALRFSRRVGSWLSLAGAVLLLASPVGCGGDDGDDNDNDGENRSRPVAGTFVGKVQGTEAFVAVVAAPPAKGEDRREVTALVCDAKQVCGWFAGSTTGNRFVAKPADGEGQAAGNLSGKAATGSVKLPDGDTVRYNATEATASAGLYDLTVSAAGKLRGASATGVALRGDVTLPPPGSGKLKLADGSRLKFKVTRNSAAETARLRAGQVRLIVLPDGQLRGAGQSRGGDATAFSIRSAKG
jgi:hypothetical protein